jgi:hypothetical protein
MNHPKFSNTENLGFFTPKMTVYGLFFASLKNRPLKKSIGASVFLMKNLRFLFKNTLAPKKTHPHDFRAKRERVRNKS